MVNAMTQHHAAKESPKTMKKKPTILRYFLYLPSPLSISSPLSPLLSPRSSLLSSTLHPARRVITLVAVRALIEAPDVFLRVTAADKKRDGEKCGCCEFPEMENGRKLAFLKLDQISDPVNDHSRTIKINKNSKKSS
jgi:hypothetical protein